MSSASPLDSTHSIVKALDISEHPLNDSAVRRLVAALTLPATRPEPSAHPDDPFNIAFRSLELLSQHLHSLPPTAKAWTEPLMVQVVESVMAFVLYYVREIALRGKILEFRDTAGHNLHSVAMQVVDALDMHPFADEEHPKSKAYGRDLKVFLAQVLPGLLLTYDAMDTSSVETASYVSLLFEQMKRLYRPEDPAWRNPFYNTFFLTLNDQPAMNSVFASGFLIAAQGFRAELVGRQPPHVATAEDHRETSFSIFFAFRFLLPFLLNDGVQERLLQGGLIKLICEIISALAGDAREAVVDVTDTRELWMTLGTSAGALKMLGQHIILQLESEGRVRVELVVDSDVLHQMRNYDRLLYEICSPTESHDKMVSEYDLKRQMDLQDKFIKVLKPFLTYYDILEKVSKWILNSKSARESPVWTTFAEEIRSLENDRITFDKAYRESCQAKECPNSYSKSLLQLALHRSPMTLSEDCQKLASANSETQFTLFRCSGCRLINYCSQECQQSDWKDHKSVCASVKKDRRKTGGLTNVLSRRDITFMHTIACLTLSRSPPPDGLIRDMDFTTSPPSLTLTKLDKPVPGNTVIVVGEQEIHSNVVRKRVLAHMRGLGKKVGIMYNRRFLPKRTEAVLTFVDWDMEDEHGLRFKRRC